MCFHWRQDNRSYISAATGESRGAARHSRGKSPAGTHMSQKQHFPHAHLDWQLAPVHATLTALSIALSTHCAPLARVRSVPISLHGVMLNSRSGQAGPICAATADGQLVSTGLRQKDSLDIFSSHEHCVYKSAKFMYHSNLREHDYFSNQIKQIQIHVIESNLKTALK